MLIFTVLKDSEVPCSDSNRTAVTLFQYIYSESRVVLHDVNTTELFVQLCHTLMNCCLLFWCEEYSQLDKYFVAVVEKSCANKYSTIFANCENEATIYPSTYTNLLFTLHHLCNVIQMEFHLMGVSFVYLILQIWQISLCLQYCLQFSWYLLVHAYFLTCCFDKKSRLFISFSYLLLWGNDLFS